MDNVKDGAFFARDEATPLEPIPVSESAKTPEFDHGLFGSEGDGLRLYYDALWETCEVSAPFLMASALTQIGTVAGRHICVALNHNPETRQVLYPNFYNILVGATALARKSSAIRTSVHVLQDIDAERNILFMDNVASSEGLVDALARDEDGELLAVDEFAKSPEGQRLFLHIDEGKRLFLNARRTSTASIIPTLTDLYDNPRQRTVRTKSASLVAPYPTVNLMIGTTGAWLQDSVTISDMEGGFINRFLFWQAEWTEACPRLKDPDKLTLAKWMDRLIRIRSKFPNGQRFMLTEQAWEIHDEAYEKHRAMLWKNQEDISSTLKVRFFNHAFKIALAIAAVNNETGNNQIDGTTWVRATQIAEYACLAAIQATEDISADLMIKKEQLFLKTLARLGNKATRTNLRTRIGGKILSTADFNKVLENLITAGIIETEGERPLYIVRVQD